MTDKTKPKPTAPRKHKSADDLLEEAAATVERAAELAVKAHDPERVVAVMRLAATIREHKSDGRRQMDATP